MRKYLIMAVVGLAVAGGLAWVVIASNQPTPGMDQLQSGRNHVPEGSQISYQQNPHDLPTSGPHYPVWISKGFYTEPRADGYLVHSMEHGYVVIWYDCEKVVSRQSSVVSIIPEVSAQVSHTGGVLGGSEGSPSAKLTDLPQDFSNGSCSSLEGQLREVLNKMGDHKLIIMPRVGMDLPVVLTAWGKIEKLSGVNFDKIKAFTDAYRDAGPEQTNEP